MNPFLLPTTIALLCATLLLAFLLFRQLRGRQGESERQMELLRHIKTRLDSEVEQNERRNRAQEEWLRTLADSLSRDQATTREKLIWQLGEAQTGQTRDASALREQIQENLAAHQIQFEQRQVEVLKTLQEALQSGLQATRQQVTDALVRSTEDMGKRFDALTGSTDKRLKEITAQVETRLGEGFEKTTATFADVLKRLALIDEAQKKITELSSNVVSLQEVLADKRSRGAFGEVQLSALIRNILPQSSFSLQHTLSNKKIADCVLFLPEPTGIVAIDAKFPLESYSRMMDIQLGEADRRTAERQFKQDVRKHIQDIAEKYIIPGETSEGAVMFIPAEAVFAEIQAHHQDIVELAWEKRVWMVSPTTMMAVLNTARAVLKDAATREQIVAIQRHLHDLAQDFGRFHTRMDNLARHIRQAGKDVDEVHISARKITERFQRIEQVELDDVAAQNHDGPTGLRGKNEEN